MRTITTAFCVLMMSSGLFAQEEGGRLPSAPAPQNVLIRPTLSYASIRSRQQQAPASPATTPPSKPSIVPSQTLTLKDAEAIAIKNNPQISVSRLVALASQQVTREAKSSFWPTAVADITGVDAQENSRISAGGLNNPIIYERAAGGVTVSQLITDFGRTSSLASSANLAAKAEAENALATRQQVLLAVNQAFFNALQTHAVLKVAEQTVNARQVLADQVGALAKNKLKSDLDLSFANVNLAQAKLLLLDAQNNDKAALASLSAVLGFPSVQEFVLQDVSEAGTAPPGDVDSLINTAFSTRPELLAQDFQYRSAQKFQTAERDLMLPSLRALGTVGGAPVRNDHLPSWYGAVGANLDIPIFNGFLYSARAREAELRSEAVRDRGVDLRNRIARDVRTSWLSANNAYERLGVSKQLLEQAQLALELAQARYKLGLSSIVELSQAQLQATQAEIGSAQAGYDYSLALAMLQFETSGL